MPTEDKPTAEQTPATDEPKLTVPEPPPPVDVGGWEIATESAKPDLTNTFFTESVDDKSRK